MAEIIDNLLFASELGKRPQVAKLAEQHNSGAASFVMESLDGWANQCSFVVYEVDTDGNPILGSETDWIGVRSGRNIQYAIKTSGIDRDYPASRTYAVATETAGARNKLIESLLRILDTDGSLKQDIIDGLNIKDNTITGDKLANATISGGKLAGKTITNRELADSAIKTNNVDWETINAIQCGISTASKRLGGNKAIKFDQTDYKRGNNLTLDLNSGEVIIGDGIKAIMVSGSITGDYVSGFKRYALKKNSTKLAFCFSSNADSSSYMHGALPTVVTPVSKNDRICLWSEDQEANLWGRGTYLTVVQIG